MQHCRKKLSLFYKTMAIRNFTKFLKRSLFRWSEESLYNNRTYKSVMIFHIHPVCNEWALGSNMSRVHPVCNEWALGSNMSRVHPVCNEWALRSNVSRVHPVCNEWALGSNMSSIHPVCNEWALGSNMSRVHPVCNEWALGSNMSSIHPVCVQGINTGSKTSQIHPECREWMLGSKKFHIYTVSGLIFWSKWRMTQYCASENETQKCWNVFVATHLSVNGLDCCHVIFTEYWIGCHFRKCISLVNKSCIPFEATFSTNKEKQWKLSQITSGDFPERMPRHKGVHQSTAWPIFPPKRRKEWKKFWPGGGCLAHLDSRLLADHMCKMLCDVKDIISLKFAQRLTQFCQVVDVSIDTKSE